MAQFFMSWEDGVCVCVCVGGPSVKRIEPTSVPGYLQSLREKNYEDIRRMAAVSREKTGRSVVSANFPLGRDMRLESMCSDQSTIPPNIVASCDDVARERKDNARDVASGPDSRHPILTSEGKPVIFAPDEFERWAKDANRVVADVPRDSISFDFAGLVGPHRDIPFKSDKWTELRKDGEKEWGIPGVITQRETEVESTWRQPIFTAI